MWSGYATLLLLGILFLMFIILVIMEGIKENKYRGKNGK